MTTEELATRTISEMAPLLARRQVSPVELVRSFLDRIQRLDKVLNCYITVLADQSLAAAQEAERAIATGSYRGPLHGIPISLKDLYYTQGVRTTGGTKILADFVPEQDATTVRRLKAAGAIILGKTNMHEFACGATNENPHYGPVRNPWDIGRVSGGSSGGSGAAVAASLCAASMGSDTGGSIRIPAAFCGIVGLKPTYGRVSRAGLIPVSWSLDHPGPLTKSVADAAIMLEAIAGYDPADPASAKAPTEKFATALTGDIKGLQVGFLRWHFLDVADEEVRAAVERAAKVFAELGATIREVELPWAETGYAAGYLITRVEASAYHEQYLATRAADYGNDVRERVSWGRLVLATDYVKALRARTLLCRAAAEMMASLDVLMAPTMAVAATPIGAKEVRVGDRTEPLPDILIRLTRYFNLVGLPAISVPCGFTDSGLPIGLQLVGKPFAEATILRAAAAYEGATDWQRRQPPL